MNNGNDIVKHSGLKPASFSTPSRGTLQIEMIVDLLKSSIENGKQISIDDIIETYMNWKEKVGREFTKEVWNGAGAYSRGLPNYSHVVVTRDEYKKQYGVSMQARNWFKSNLGSAIIKGKILAIPIINL